MAASEGAFRIKRVGQWLICLGLLVIVLTVIYQLGERLMMWRTLPFITTHVIFLGSCPILLGIVIWIIGWIADGFAQPSN